MGTRPKIKKIKDYIKEGPPQFDVILRLDAGKTVDVHVMSGKKDIVNRTLVPPESGEGIIKIVKRINDDVVFHQSDMVDVENCESCFIVEFHEDLINCTVVSAYLMEGNEPFVVEINKLSQHEVFFQHEAGEEEHGGDYEPEDLTDEQ